MKRFDLITGIRIAGAALTASLALVLASASFLAPFLGMPELDPARKVILSALCIIGPVAFAWASMKVDRAVKHSDQHDARTQCDIAAKISKAA